MQELLLISSEKNSMLKRFIEQLIGELHVSPSQCVEDKGQYTLTFDPKLPMTLAENAEGEIKLQATLAELPQEKTDEYLLFAMTSNLFGEETGGNFLGLSIDEKEMTLNRLVDKDVDYPEFKLFLEEFLNYYENWRVDTKAYVGS